MQPPPDPDEPGTPSGFRFGFVSGVLAFPTLIGIIAYIAVFWVAYSGAELQPPRTLGPPLHVTSAGREGVYLMTAQQETRVVGGRSLWRAYEGVETVTHVDAWRFDVASAQPLWRKRLLTAQRLYMGDMGMLGADGDRLWLFMGEPLVLSLANGEVLANAAHIETRNTVLKGVLPRQKNHYSFFERYGLAFTAADARAWLLDAHTLEVVPWQPGKTAQRPEIVAPAYFAPTSIASFQKRGLLFTRDWLGVLTDDEAAALNGEIQVPGAQPGERRGAMAAFLESTRAPPDLAHTGPKRYRLWRAKVEQVSAAPDGWPKELPDKWGKRPRYSNFSVFGTSAEFLQAGLMSDGRAKLPIMLKAPDSVLVLHRDRIDEDGRVVVTRIAGPEGRVLWDARLPLSIPQSVMPGASSLVLFGRAYQQPRPQGDPYNSAHEWLVSLDLATGAVKAFDLSAADEDRKQ